MTRTQQQIERAFQRAMGIRDTTPGWVPDILENRYAKAYRKAFRTDNAEGFQKETRFYLRELRKAAIEEGSL